MKVCVFVCVHMRVKMSEFAARTQTGVVGVWSHMCEENQFKHNQKLRGIKATVMR